MLFFVFKQKTAYEMRISDWSSDVCSSDLGGWQGKHPLRAAGRCCWRARSGGERDRSGLPAPGEQFGEPGLRQVGDACEHVGEPRLRIDVVEIGRASCRERVWQYV